MPDRPEDKKITINDPDSVAESRRQTGKLEDISRDLGDYSDKIESHNNNLSEVMEKLSESTSEMVSEIQRIRQEEKDRRDKEDREKTSERRSEMLQSAREKITGAGSRMTNSPLNFIGKGGGVGGMFSWLGSLARGRAFGLGASITAIMIAGSLIDGVKLKDNIDAILSIGEGLDIASLVGRFATISTGLWVLGKGLTAFAIGSLGAILTDGISLGINWLIDDPDNSWSRNLVSHVKNILSLGDSNWLDLLGDVTKATGSLIALGTGLSVFAIGSLGAILTDGISHGINWLVNDPNNSWSANIVSHVKNILSLGDSGWLRTLGDSAGLFAVMTGISAGILAFSITDIIASMGSGISRGISWFTGSSWSEDIKTHVENLMGILDIIPSYGAASFVSNMGLISSGVLAFSLGEILGAAGSGVSWVFTGQRSWSESIKGHVRNLMDILDFTESDQGNKASVLRSTLISLSGGIRQFSSDILASSVSSRISLWMDPQASWSESIVQHVRNLSDITSLNFNRFNPRSFATFLIGIGEGIKAFATGERAAAINNFLGEIFRQDDWASKLVSNVRTIVAITDNQNLNVSKSRDINTILTEIGSGIGSFANMVRNEDESIFSRFGVALGNFFFGDDSPIGKLKEAVSATSDLSRVVNAFQEFNIVLERFMGNIINIDYDPSRLSFVKMVDDLYIAALKLEQINLGNPVGYQYRLPDGGTGYLTSPFRSNMEGIADTINDFRSDRNMMDFINGVTRNNALSNSSETGSSVTIYNIDNSVNNYANPINTNQSVYNMSTIPDNIIGSPAIP